MIPRLQSKWRSLVHRMKDRLVPGPRILLYHRVADLPADPQQLAVSPEHFAEHLAVLRAHATPMTLTEMVEALREDRLPRNAVAVTFDDGYADNLLQAKPLLERFEMPATVFVATGTLGTAEEFWWDELARLLLQPGPLPTYLRLALPGGARSWDFTQAKTLDAATADRFAAWSVADRRTPTERHRAYRALCGLLRPLDAAARREALMTLRGWAGATAAGRPTHRPLTPPEVVKLARGGLVEIGAHTVTHAYLAALPAAEQRREIVECRDTLAALLGHPITTFSYPFGSPASFSAETCDIVREAGFTCACANIPDVVTPRSDPWQLPRSLVRNWDRETFIRRLRPVLRHIPR